MAGGCAGAARRPAWPLPGSRVRGGPDPLLPAALGRSPLLATVREHPPSADQHLARALLTAPTTSWAIRRPPGRTRTTGPGGAAAASRLLTALTAPPGAARAVLHAATALPEAGEVDLARTAG
ncbi:hypothetical protein [Streptomyces sp. MJP52]|uniref:hypothetical protein n=1 Tax=Streptomyces sp. MJP52 TaxID=2940555 RepID=UPI0024732208|nr:hypothetical protein [Streptomyces sp. MJP52]MDH6223075.1 hypothetical protein [Streptomyces sp. MJP52]